MEISEHKCVKCGGKAGSLGVCQKCICGEKDFLKWYPKEQMVMKRVKWLLAIYDISAKDAAEKMDIRYGELTKYCTGGLASDITYLSIKKICNHFKVPYNFFEERISIQIHVKNEIVKITTIYKHNDNGKGKIVINIVD